MKRLAWIVPMLIVICGVTEAQFLGPGGTIPAVANIPGFSGTFWRTDVSILNPNEGSTTVVLQLFPETNPGGDVTFETQLADPFSIPGNTQVTLTNIVQSKFGLINKKGSLMVYTTDGAPIALNARTFTVDNEGKSYGHGVTGALASGSAWVNGLAQDSLYRTNIGIFWPWEERVTFTISAYHSDGRLAGAGPVTFVRSGLQQPPLTQFGVENMVDGYVVITCSDPTAIWYAYGSRVDQNSGDAVLKAALGYRFEVN
ncbi:MAG: hypothetical protein GY906_29355 [bacterium]|nr:hypothetical protein [bacterium]